MMVESSNSAASIYLDEIVRLVNCPGNQENVNWDAVETRLGIRLPRDYKEYVRVFPDGRLRTYLSIYTPSTEDISPEITQAVHGLRVLWNQCADDGDLDHFPFTIYPNHGGLFPWGLIDFEFLICWDTSGTDYDSWPIVVVDSMLDEYWMHRGPMTKFLLDFLQGATDIADMGYTDDAPVVFDEIIG